MNRPGPRHLVVVSLEPWDEVWRRNQYLLDGLLRRDDSLEILFVEPPADPIFDFITRRRVRRGCGVRSAPHYEGRLTLYQPTKLLPRAVGPVADAMLLANTRQVISKLGWTFGVLWINDLGSSGLVRSLGWPSLYDITDDWVLADRGEREHRRLVAADTELLEMCDEVIVCSRGLELTKGRIRPVRLIPNAVDVDRYRQSYERPRDMPENPAALYVGTLHEDRLDIDLVIDTATAASVTDGIVALVGPNALGANNTRRLAAHPNIALFDARDREEIPAWLQHAHAVIVPHIVDDFTDSLDPLKLYEYLAVGRPIVSTPVAGFRDSPSAQIADRHEFPAAVAGRLVVWTATVDNTVVPTWEDRVTSVLTLIESMPLVSQGDTT